MTRSFRTGRPNIIIVLVDTLRADHLSCYGHERQATPWLDRIAETGLLYENAISAAAWTPPAHASLFTGTLPSRHGVSRSRLVLDPALATLPEVLRNSGYRTFGVSNNYWLSRETRFDRGFDDFLHGWQLVQMTGRNAPLQRQQKRQDLGLERLNGASRTALRDRCGDLVNTMYDRATQRLLRPLRAYDDGAWRVSRIIRRWLPEWKDSERPFFAFIHYMEPHIKYRPPGRYARMHTPRGVGERRIRRVNQNPWRYVVGAREMDEEELAILAGLYDGEISYVDERIGQMYEAWREQGVLRNTVLIITSDHGENLGDHHLMDHQYCLYDTLLRVPLIIRYPPEFPPGERIKDQIRMVDLFPTLLELAGVRDESVWSQVQGEALFPAGIRGKSERPAISEYLEPQPPVSVLRAKYPECNVDKYDRILRAIRTGGYKYIWASDGANEMYDLSNDPREEHNLIAVEVERVAAMHAMLERGVGSFDLAPTGSEAVELDPETRKRLQDLGYLA